MSRMVSVPSVWLRLVETAIGVVRCYTRDVTQHDRVHIESNPGRPFLWTCTAAGSHLAWADNVDGRARFVLLRLVLDAVNAGGVVRGCHDGETLSEIRNASDLDAFLVEVERIDPKG